MKSTQSIYEVTYTTKVGGINTILVKAINDITALKNAKQHCFTGSDFRNPTITNKPYTTPRKQGFNGSDR